MISEEAQELEEHFDFDIPKIVKRTLKEVNTNKINQALPDGEYPEEYNFSHRYSGSLIKCQNPNTGSSIKLTAVSHFKLKVDDKIYSGDEAQKYIRENQLTDSELIEKCNILPTSTKLPSSSFFIKTRKSITTRYYKYFTVSLKRALTKGLPYIFNLPQHNISKNIETRLIDITKEWNNRKGYEKIMRRWDDFYKDVKNDYKKSQKKEKLYDWITEEDVD